ncbi:hypothetical protein [Bdellovibrio sp. BCCA]|uniref:hypothetical protein n=1 Tax=Bdellovibrio sp. BCCA TaxID=3136281 RepID=UPI0030F04660
MKSLGGAFLLVVVHLMFALTARADGYNISGKILKPDGTPYSGSAVSFLLEVTNPAGTCALYREQIVGVDMSNTKGAFHVILGSGSRIFPTTGALESLFSNDSVLNCSDGSTYTPLTNDERSIKISFYDGSAWQAFAQQPLKSVPLSTIARVSGSTKTIDTYSAANLLRSKTTVPELTAADVTNLQALLGGTSTTYLKTETDPTVKAFAKTNLPTCAVGTVLKSDGTNFSCVTDNAGMSLPTGTAGKYLRHDGTNWVAAAPTIADITNLSTQLSDKVSKMQVPSCTANQTTNYNFITDAWQCLDINQALAGDVTGTMAANVVSKIRNVAVSTTTPSTGQVLKFDGTSWAPAPDNTGAGGTVTSVGTGTGLTGGPVTGTGTISLANTSVTTGTYGSANQVGSFIVDAQGRLTNATNIAINFPVTSIATKTGAVTLDYGDIQSATSRYMTYKPNNIACADGQILRWVASGTRWECSTDTTGTVTNVTSGNSYVTVANGTTTPTITLNVGSGAGTVAAGNDARLSDARTPAGAATGDLGGNYPSPTVARIQGVPVDTSAGLQDGDSLVYNSTSGKWILKRAGGCEAGWTRVNKGAPFCIKQMDATLRTFGASLILCSDAGADLCTTTQLVHACRDGNKLALNATAWTTSLFAGNVALALNCSSSGGAYGVSSEDLSMAPAKSSYCCKPASN